MALSRKDGVFKKRRQQQLENGIVLAIPEKVPMWKWEDKCHNDKKTSRTIWSGALKKLLKIDFTT